MIKREPIIKRYPRSYRLKDFSSEPDEGYINALKPTINSPITPSPHPTICLFYIFILSNILEKSSVVTMLPPIRILYVDPGIKLRAMYCIIERDASQSPGMIKM